jgi:hypothetical protein
MMSYDLSNNPKHAIREKMTTTRYVARRRQHTKRHDEDNTLHDTTKVTHYTTLRGQFTTRPDKDNILRDTTKSIRCTTWQRKYTTLQDKDNTLRDTTKTKATFYETRQRQHATRHDGGNILCAKTKHLCINELLFLKKYRFFYKINQSLIYQILFFSLVPDKKMGKINEHKGYNSKPIFKSVMVLVRFSFIR